MARGWSLLVFLLIVFAAAWFGAQFEPGAWYAQAEKPDWTPPNSLFGPVWTGLYILIAVAAWLVFRQAGARGRVLALMAWSGQLILNAIWPWLFFGMHRIGWALGEILLLWLAIVVTILLFWRVRPLAGALLLPYLAWISFATALNFAIWQLNGGGI